MVKKLGLISLFSSSGSSKDSSSSSGISSAAAGLLRPSSSSSMSAASSWQWPSCKQPRTLSFRQQQQKQHHGHHMTMIKQAYKTMNSAYFPDSADSCFSISLASVESLSTASEASGTLVVDANEVEAEAVIRALRSDRLFFEPDASPATSSSILKKKAKVDKVKPAVNDDDDKDTTTFIDSSSSRDNKQAAFDGATAMSMESENPYRDFRASMEEMVMSHGAKDWRWLEEMLGWYLRANGKSTHGLIVGAFVDLLVALSTTDASPSSPTAATNCSSSSACSSFSGIIAAPRPARWLVAGPSPDPSYLCMSLVVISGRR